MRKHLAIALGTLALTAGIAASGCGRGSDPEAEGRVWFCARMGSSTKGCRKVSFDITKFRAEVKERFGTPPNEAPWYRHITAINWANRQLQIRTDLDEEAFNQGSEFGGIPCGLLWGLAFEQADKPPNSISVGLAILGADGVGGGCA